MTTEDCHFRIMTKIFCKRSTKSLPCEEDYMGDIQREKPIYIFSYQLTVALESEKYLIITTF